VDVALMLEAMCTPTGEIPPARPSETSAMSGAVERGPPDGLRVAYVADIAEVGIDPAIESVCRAAADALASAGAEVEEVDLDLSAGFEAFLTLRGRWMVYHHEALVDRLDELGENLAGNIRSGLELRPDQVEGAEAARERVQETVRRTLERYDHVLTPCVPVPPFPAELNYPETIGGRKMASYIEWIAPTFVLTLTGLPVACVPAGLDADGLPVGVQVLGPSFGDYDVLALAGRIAELRPIGCPPGDSPTRSGRSYSP